MRRRRKLVSLGDGILATLTGMGLTDQARRLLIHQAWAQAVGPDIAQKTAPDTFRRGVLLVRAKNPTWQNELTFLKHDIITKLNTVLGQEVVKELKVVSGEFYRPKPPPPPTPPRPLTAQEAEAVHETATPIRDPELRQIFERSMQEYLRRGSDVTKKPPRR